MRGLTDEERAILVRWQAGQYEGAAGELASYDTILRLYERGLGADTELLGPFGLAPYATVTPIGELALRCDAAARAAGVWP